MTVDGCNIFHTKMTSDSESRWRVFKEIFGEDGLKDLICHA